MGEIEANQSEVGCFGVKPITVGRLMLQIDGVNFLGSAQPLIAQVHGRDRGGNYRAYTLGGNGMVPAGAQFVLREWLHPSLVVLERVDMIGPWTYQAICSADLACIRCGVLECEHIARAQPTTLPVRPQRVGGSSIQLFRIKSAPILPGATVTLSKQCEVDCYPETIMVPPDVGAAFVLKRIFAHVKPLIDANPLVPADVFHCDSKVPPFKRELLERGLDFSITGITNTSDQTLRFECEVWGTVEVPKPLGSTETRTTYETGAPLATSVSTYPTPPGNERVVHHAPDEDRPKVQHVSGAARRFRAVCTCDNESQPMEGHAASCAHGPPPGYWERKRKHETAALRVELAPGEEVSVRVFEPVPAVSGRRDSFIRYDASLENTTDRMLEVMLLEADGKTPFVLEAPAPEAPCICQSGRTARDCPRHGAKCRHCEQALHEGRPCAAS